MSGWPYGASTAGNLQGRRFHVRSGVLPHFSGLLHIRAPHAPGRSLSSFQQRQQRQPSTPDAAMPRHGLQWGFRRLWATPGLLLQPAARCSRDRRTGRAAQDGAARSPASPSPLPPAGSPHARPRPPARSRPFPPAAGARPQRGGLRDGARSSSVVPAFFRPADPLPCLGRAHGHSEGRATLCKPCRVRWNEVKLSLKWFSHRKAAGVKV